MISAGESLILSRKLLTHIASWISKVVCAETRTTAQHLQANNKKWKTLLLPSNHDFVHRDFFWILQTNNKYLAAHFLIILSNGHVIAKYYIRYEMYFAKIQLQLFIITYMLQLFQEFNLSYVLSFVNLCGTAFTANLSKISLNYLKIKFRNFLRARFFWYSYTCSYDNFYNFL